MNVAWRFDQHSERFGQRASWHTVATPLSSTTRTVCVKSPEGNGLFNQGGNRRRGPSDLRGNTTSSTHDSSPRTHRGLSRLMNAHSGFDSTRTERARQRLNRRSRLADSRRRAAVAKAVADRGPCVPGR